MVFSCTIEDEFGVINHHWMDEEEGIFVAPLCKFDFRDTEHFMHFLAWVETIETWADAHVLTVCKALQAIAVKSRESVESIQKELLSPIIDEEKEHKRTHALQTKHEDTPLLLAVTVPPVRALAKTPLFVIARTPIPRPAVVVPQELAHPPSLSLLNVAHHPSEQENATSSPSSESIASPAENILLRRQLPQKLWQKRLQLQRESMPIQGIHHPSIPNTSISESTTKIPGAMITPNADVSMFYATPDSSPGDGIANTECAMPTAGNENIHLQTNEKANTGRCDSSFGTMVPSTLDLRRNKSFLLNAGLQARI